MPNWCENNLYIKGDKAALAEFVERVTVMDKDGKQDFEILKNLHPTPQGLIDSFEQPDVNTWDEAQREAKHQENLAAYGFKDWYQWTLSNWGTKWGDCHTYLGTDEIVDKLVFGFSSAWCPPLEGIAYIATLFPDLEFALGYEEGGMDFFGFVTFDSDGEYEDSSHEMSSIAGWDEIDFDSEDDDPYEKSMKLLYDTLTLIQTEAGW